MNLLFSLLFACSSATTESTVPIIGTTARISERHKPDENSDMKMVLMTTEKQCKDYFRILRQTKKNIGEEAYNLNMERCLPWFDRGKGEVKISTWFEYNDQPYPLLLKPEDITIIHGKSGEVITDSKNVIKKVRPHLPSEKGQLFILMIDGSNSMKEASYDDPNFSRLEMVQKALKSKGVMDEFFPKDKEINNYVAIYSFTSGDPKPVGSKTISILDNRDDYVEVINKLSTKKDYTHLYRAVEYGMTKIPKEKNIKDLLENNIQPTLVVLTDGFNNLKGTDTCSDNVKRLNNLLKKMDNIKNEKSKKGKMNVVTIGFGNRLNDIFDGSEWAEERSTVTGRHLCTQKKRVEKGRVMAQTDLTWRIDASGGRDGLERHFIDNVSLAMIAEKGSGTTFARTSAKGLEAAFKSVVALRHQWFEVYYRFNPLNMRQDFEVKYDWEGFMRATSSVNIYPHAWVDGPPGEVDRKGFPKRGSAWHSTTILSSGMGLFLFLSILGAAVFNVKRLLSGRLTRK